jgi:hypothetical protein
VQSASTQDLQEFNSLIQTHNQENPNDQAKMVDQFGKALLGPWTELFPAGCRNPCGNSATA